MIAIANTLIGLMTTAALMRRVISSGERRREPPRGIAPRIAAQRVPLGRPGASRNRSTFERRAEIHVDAAVLSLEVSYDAEEGVERLSAASAGPRAPRPACRPSSSFS